jgi:penicillin-binding protein 1A
LVAVGQGRERSYIYAENVGKAPPAEEDESTPEPKPELDKPPSD